MSDKPAILTPAFTQPGYDFTWLPAVTLRVGGVMVDIKRPMLKDQDMRLFYAVAVEVIVKGDDTTADVRGVFRVLFNTDTDRSNVQEQCRHVLEAMVKARILSTVTNPESFEGRISSTVIAASDGKLPGNQRYSFNVCLTSEELENWCDQPQQ